MLAPIEAQLTLHHSNWTILSSESQVTFHMRLAIVVYIRTVNHYNVLLKAYKVHNRIYVQGYSFAA